MHFIDPTTVVPLRGQLAGDQVLSDARAISESELLVVRGDEIVRWSSRLARSTWRVKVGIQAGFGAIKWVKNFNGVSQICVGNRLERVVLDARTGGVLSRGSDRETTSTGEAFNSHRPMGSGRRAVAFASATTHERRRVGVVDASGSVVWQADTGEVGEVEDVVPLATSGLAVLIDCQGVFTIVFVRRTGATATCTLEEMPFHLEALADGGVLASGDRQALVVGPRGTVRHRLGGVRYPETLGVTGDGTGAIGLDSGNRLAVWSASTGQLIRRHGVAGVPVDGGDRVQPLPNGGLSVFIGRDGVKVLDPTGAHVRATLTGIEDELVAARVGPGARVSAWSQRSLAVWDLTARMPMLLRPEPTDRYSEPLLALLEHLAYRSDAGTASGTKPLGRLTGGGGPSLPPHLSRTEAEVVDLHGLDVRSASARMRSMRSHVQVVWFGKGTGALRRAFIDHTSKRAGWTALPLAGQTEERPQPALGILVADSVVSSAHNPTASPEPAVDGTPTPTAKRRDADPKPAPATTNWQGWLLVAILVALVLAWSTC